MVGLFVGSVISFSIQVGGEAACERRDGGVCEEGR